MTGYFEGIGQVGFGAIGAGTGGVLGGAVGGGGGVLAGGTVGSAVPVVGTAVGAVGGGVEGAWAGGALGAAAGGGLGWYAGGGIGRGLDWVFGTGDHKAVDQANQANGLSGSNQGVCGANCAAAEKAPGKPTENDKFKPKKNWDGKKVAAPNGGGYGYPDANGNVWVPTGPDGSPAAHGGEHWDVQSPGGGYTNVYPGGNIRGGKAPFPVLP